MAKNESSTLVVNDAVRRDSLMPVAGGVTMVVTRAYGPKGDSLLGLTGTKFDGYSAITLKVEADGKEGLVHLSPIHGDKRKEGFVDIKPGTRCKLSCPVSGLPLDRIGPVDDGTGAEYYAIYLSDKASAGACVMITDIWDHYHSRVVDDNAVISHWVRNHPED